MTENLTNYVDKYRQKQIDPVWYGWIFLMVSVIVAVLRAITDSPIFKAAQNREAGQ